MKLSTIAKKLGFIFCILGVLSSIGVFWQLVAISSTPGPVDPGYLFYANIAAMILLPIIGIYLMKLSVTLMLRCR